MTENRIGVLRSPAETGSRIFHKCSPDMPDACDCGYDAICTGKFHRRLRPVPRWLDVLMRPRWYWRVWQTRRHLARI